MSVDTASSADDESSDPTTPISPPSDGPSPGFELTIRAHTTLDHDYRIRAIGDDIRYETPPAVSEWDTDVITHFECEQCEAVLPNEDEATQHLDSHLTRRALYRLPGIPSTDPARSGHDPLIVFGDVENRRVDGVEATFRVSRDRFLAHILEGAGAFLATSRRSYSLPEGLAFDDWEPATSGSLALHDNRIRLSLRHLRRAVKYICTTSGMRFDPEAFRLYDRGDNHLFVLTGYGQSICIAPRVYDWE